MTRAVLSAALVSSLTAGPLSELSRAAGFALSLVGLSAAALFVALARRGGRIAEPRAAEEECAPTHSGVRARKKSAPAGAGADGRLAAAARGSLAHREGTQPTPERRIARGRAAGTFSPEAS